MKPAKLRLRRNSLVVRFQYVFSDLQINMFAQSADAALDALVNHVRVSLGDRTSSLSQASKATSNASVRQRIGLVRSGCAAVQQGLCLALGPERDMTPVAVPTQNAGASPGVGNQGQNSAHMRDEADQRSLLLHRVPLHARVALHALTRHRVPNLPSDR